ncbi:MAG: hypothetical protein NPIRA03_25890 [Nitrospirales bacterium]|nr:MAG: hypothetical protein NPIRA03_25890 [Nitrospirales bacterium]
MTDSNTIAELNDRFRSRLHIPQFGTPDIPGKFLLTRGVANLLPQDQIIILAEVREFNAFTEDNDPYGEHDFGSLDHNGQKIFWKIDYYAPDMMHGSENPADPSQTVRVLTIMLAEEY